MAIPSLVSDQKLQFLSAAGLWTSFVAGLGWAFIGYFLHRERFASYAGGLSCIAALISSLCANELANRSNDVVLAAISARTLHDTDVAVLNNIIPAGNIIINVQYEGDEPSKRGMHNDEEYGFKFSLENAFKATTAAKEGRLKVEPYALPTLGFNYGVDICLYVPNHRTDLSGTLKDPIYKALTLMGFSVLPFNHAFEDWPEHIIEIDDYDGFVYPDYYIISINPKPPARLKGRPYWGPNIPN